MPEASALEGPRRTLTWRGHVSYLPCPYCGAMHYVTGDEDMYRDALEFGKDIILAPPFNIVISSRERWKDISSGPVFVPKCTKCGKLYVIHMYQRNYGDFHRYNELRIFYPSMQEPPTKFGFKAKTIGRFAEEINNTRNPLVRAKMFREMSARGVKFVLDDTQKPEKKSNTEP